MIWIWVRLSLVFVLRQDCLIQTSDVLGVLLRAQAAAICTVLHLFLGQKGALGRFRILAVTVLLDYCVKRVQVWITRAHRLTRTRRHDSSGRSPFFNSQSIIVLSHILLLADQTIQTLDVLRAQLAVLQIACLLSSGVSSHVFEFNVVRVEVLNDADVVGSGALSSVQHVRHASVRRRWHLRTVETSGSRLLIANTLHILCVGSHRPDRADLVLVLPNRLKLMRLGVINAIIE